MNYKLYLILFILLIFSANTTSAQEKHYRVEVIVLSHLQHDSEPLKADWLRNFSDSLDFLAVVDPDEADEEANVTEEVSLEAGTEGAATQTLDGEFPDEQEEESDPWAEVQHIEAMGEIMQEAWRRLRLSAPFRPQQYLSWVQSPDEPFPLLRIHNQEVILIDDPYAEERVEQSAAEIDSDFVFSDQGQALPDDPDAVPELPEPILFYHVDGTVMLRRTRFLHLDLDLELREAVYDDSLMTQALIASEESTGEDIPMPQPSSFLVHNLKQSRQVKSARMEYFDGPVLSVLAYISSVDVEQEPEIPDSADN